MHRKIISIIPARKGSKRFKNKNVAKFCKFSLALWTFYFSQTCDLFDIGYVNTDIPELVNRIGKYSKLKVCTREKNLAADKATLIDVIRDTCIKKSLNKKDIIVLLPVTGLLRTYKDVSLGIDAFLKGNGKTVVSVSASSYPASMLWRLSANNRLNPLFPKHFKNSTQKQDHFPTYMFNDFFVIDTVEGFLRSNRNLYGNNTKAFIVPSDRFMPIDYEYQFFLAEKLFELGQKSGIYPLKC
jgi:CMP-N,N'-diacetyllegionaminic acid synthase